MPAARLDCLAIALLLVSMSTPAAAQDAPKPREAALGFYVNGIRNVDSVNESFDVDYFLNVIWEEPSAQTADTDWSKIWNPMVDSVNATNPGKQWEHYRLLRPGRVMLEARYASTFDAPMDLRKFPFDRQVLPIVFESATFRRPDLVFLYEARPDHPVHLSAELPYVVNKALVLSPELHLPEWTIERVQVRGLVSHYGFENDSEWSRFRIELVMSRNYGFYIWRVFAVQVLIVALSFLVFLFDPTGLGDRMSFSLTLFLAAVAFSFVTSGLIPRISYLTLLDVFMLGSYAVIFLSVAENALVYLLTLRGKAATAQRIDRASMIAAPTLFVAFLGLIAVLAVV